MTVQSVYIIKSAPCMHTQKQSYLKQYIVLYHEVQKRRKLIVQNIENVFTFWVQPRLPDWVSIRRTEGVQEAMMLH